MVCTISKSICSVKEVVSVTLLVDLQKFVQFTNIDFDGIGLSLFHYHFLHISNMYYKLCNLNVKDINVWLQEVEVEVNAK